MPQYSIRYEEGSDSIVFTLNERGNTPGPPTSVRPIDVHGFEGQLLYATGIANGQMQDFFSVSWQEGLAEYEIRISSFDQAISQDDVLQMAQSLTPLE